MKSRVVVTGVGVVSGLGLGVNKFWSGMRGKKSAIRPISWPAWESAPVQVAAGLEEPLPGEGCRNLRMADWALREALGQSRPEGVGGLAAAIGWSGPDEEVEEGNPLDWLASKHSLGGIRMESLAACAASTQMIAEAFWRVRSGEVDWMAAGGADGRVHPAGILGYDRLGALARGFRDRPGEACRPFGMGRAGFVVGEGAGFMVLENRERAEARGARILAEIRGASVGCDAWRITDPGTGGVEAEVCVRNCLEDAGIGAHEVDTVVAHGTGTEANDRVEAEVYQRIFGEKRPRVLAPKAGLGHLSMACGAVESVLAVKCLETGCVAGPEAGDWEMDPACLRSKEPSNSRGAPLCILKPSFGFGGQNASVIFSGFQK